eukprot:gene49953-61148_t
MDAEAASRLIAAAADATLVLDGDGVIRDMAFGNADLAAALGGRKAWVGRALADSVAEDSRGKVTDMLGSAAAHEPPRWRHLNLRGTDGTSLPLLCAANHVSGSDRSIVFARYLRLLASLQQRLVEAQQAMEREYGRLRQAETRYRLLFQMSGEPVLVLDAASLAHEPRDWLMEHAAVAPEVRVRPNIRATGPRMPPNAMAPSSQ